MGSESRNRYLLKNTLIFTLGNIGSRMISFFLIPLYTNVLTTSQYGTVDLITTISTVAGPMLTLNIAESVMRFGLDKDADKEKNTQCGSIVLLIAMIIGLVLIPICRCITEVSDYAMYVYFYVISLSASQLFLCDLRGKELLLKYSLGNILQTLMIAILNITFLLVFKMETGGYLLAYIIANFIVAIYAIIAGKGYKAFSFHNIDFSFGFLVLIYWQLMERRFRDSDMSFMDSLFGLFSGCYDNLEFNIHLWFLPCFFVTVILFNILVNLGGRRMAYLVSALMSLAFIVVPMHGLIWGIDRVFKYIGFYAVGVFIAGKSVKAVKKKVKAGIVAIVLLALSFSLSCYHLTMGIMWFVTALIGVAAVILISQLINENRILQYFGRISLIILCIHGPVYRIVVKIVSILLNLGTDAVRENFLLAMVVVVITMAICSTAYEVVVRLAPWMVGKKKVKEN